MEVEAKMILGVQLLGVLFGLFMIYLTFLYRKRKELDQKESAVWFIMWAIFIAISLFPGILSPIVRSLSFARTMDMLVIMGFMVVIGIGFYNYHVLRNTQKKVEEIVRKVALKGKEK